MSHPKRKRTPAYPPAAALAVGAAAMLASVGSAAWAQDASAGEALYRKHCRACHLIGEGARHTVGPVLTDVAGRAAGSAAGYLYSQSLKELAAGGLVWTDDKLATYLESPKSVVPNGRMSFAGLKDKADRDAVIAFLKRAQQ